jgi:hypothetical protein
MLRGLALDHYYTNLKSNPLGVSFDKLYDAIKLRTVIDKHIEKSTIECL